MKHRHTFIIYLYVMAVSLALNACSSARNASAAYTPPAAASAATRIFLQQLQADMQQQKVRPAQYIPSPELMRQYAIQKTGEAYYVQGFLTLQEGYAASDIQDACCKINTAMGTMLTVQINILQLDRFLHDAKIKYFEIATPVQPNF